MTELPQQPRPPKSLKVRGKILWREIVATFDPEADELDLLLETCRILDVIDALSDRIDVDGVMISGSQGQSVLNPAISERRQQQQQFARSISALNLHTSSEKTAIISGATRSAQAAANARWSSLNRAKNA